MSMFFASMMKALFSWSLLSVLLLQFGGVEKSDASEMTTKFQTLDMSLLDHLSSPANSTSCNRASKTGFGNRLKVVHKDSPCAHENNEKLGTKLSFAKILDNDQLRVKFIQARVVQSIDTNKLMSLDKEAKLPARSGLPLKSGNYIVTIGLGTPKRYLTLVFDTGSELTWTQCQPCLGSCYRQKDPIFDPHNSTSYSSISCKSKDCPHDPTSFGCYHNTMCAYNISYGDSSYTEGFLSKEKLTITPTYVFPDFLFGCGQDNDGLFGKTDGILGLSIEPLSFVSQTAQKYRKYFSYCLPKNIRSTGFLAFGKNNSKTIQISTPFVPPPPHVPNIFYFIEITAISVGGKHLQINRSIFKKAGTVIDSGTVITRLPPAAYKTMSQEFKKQMNMNYTSAPKFSILDTCFSFSPNTNNIQIPTVSFTFKGNARVDLDASGILLSVSSRYACLAFAGNEYPSDLAIFGNFQQSTFEVAYDVAGKKLGFINNPKCQ